jgi:hypothetical protein
MAAKDMMDALQNPHTEVPFACVENTPSRHLLNWLQFSNSNYDKLNLQRFQLRLPWSLNAQYPPNHPIRS